ncbi:MAG TPA: hypothetical protein V6C57_22665 [Coleofasciculaceae cyanobacterium]
MIAPPIATLLCHAGVAKFLGFPHHPKPGERIMSKDFFIALTQNAPLTASSPQAKVRVILLGTPQDVNTVIYDLHQRGFAEVAAWSPPQSIPDSREIIRVHIRRFGRHGG